VVVLLCRGLLRRGFLFTVVGLGGGLLRSRLGFGRFGLGRRLLRRRGLGLGLRGGRLLGRRLGLGGRFGFHDRRFGGGEGFLGLHRGGFLRRLGGFGGANGQAAGAGVEFGLRGQVDLAVPLGL